MVGFTDVEILEIRKGSASFDARLDALAKLVKNIAVERGQTNPELVQAFFSAGWTEANLVDAIVVIGDKIISNYLFGSTKIRIDFPAAPDLV
jgi:hypothetical protein